MSSLSEGGHTLAVTVTNQTDTNPASGNTWTDNPGGAAWTIKYASPTIDANFQSNGDLLVTGAGASNLSFAFSHNDASSYGKALGTYALPQLNVSFTQGSSQTGSDSATANSIVAGNYAATILNANAAGFTVENGGKKLCFKDGDGSDCNAEVVVTVGATDAIIASSLDLNTLGDGNLFWHTRKATGYTYTTT